MLKFIRSLLVLSTCLWLSSAFADNDESALASLHKGKIVLSCVHVEFKEGGERTAVNVTMHQQGGSGNWAVGTATFAEGCPEFVAPTLTEESLATGEEEEEEEVAEEEEEEEEEGVDEEA